MNNICTDCPLHRLHKDVDGQTYRHAHTDTIGQANCKQGQNLRQKLAMAMPGTLL